MLDLLHRMTEWLDGFADSEWSIVVLAVDSFTEAIFNPIPPDPLLIGISLINPGSALWLAGIVTITSVLGAVVGYWLGGKYGRPLLNRFVKKEKVDRVERMFKTYGAWAVLLAAFTPLPFKIFTITAGMLNLNRRSFVLAAIAGRGARFFLIGGLVYFYGDSIQDFISTRFDVIMIVSGGAVLVAVAAFVIVSRYRKSRANGALRQGSPAE